MRGTAETQGLFWDTDALCGDLIEEEGFLAALGGPGGRSSPMMTSITCTPPRGDAPPTRRRCSPRCCSPSSSMGCPTGRLSAGAASTCRGRRPWGSPSTTGGSPTCAWRSSEPGLLRAGMEGFLHTKLLEVACQAGVVRTSRAIDSTGIHDSVVTQDTVTLIRQALRRCLHRLQEIDPEGARSVRGRLRRDDYEAQGKPQILWSDPGPEPSSWRRCSATPSIQALIPHRSNPLRIHRSMALLLAQVAGQDLEVEKDEGGGPKVSIRRGVAPERIISLVDPEARHGHRSRFDRYDGYKVHLSVDLDSDLITAAEATHATAPDGALLPRLLDADPVKVQQVVADTAYGSGDIREDMAECGIELIAPAPPPVAPGGRFTKADFTIDLHLGTATCPAGHTVSPHLRTGRQERKRVQFRFPAELCGACPLRERCTTSPRGRIVEIGPHEGLLQQARSERWTESFRDRYGRRRRSRGRS